MKAAALRIRQRRQRVIGAVVAEMCHHANQRRSSDWIVGVSRVRL